MDLRQMCPATYRFQSHRYTSLSTEELEQRLVHSISQEAELRDLGWRIEIFRAQLEALEKRARLEEERAAEFHSLTADLFVDVLRQHERINGTSLPRASNPLDHSTIRLIDFVSNEDRKRFLTILQPSSDEYHWLESFSEIIQYRNRDTYQSKERLARRLSLPPYRYSLDYYFLVPLFEYAYEASIEEVIKEEAKRIRDISRDEGESLSKWNEFYESFRHWPRVGTMDEISRIKMPESRDQ